jgi:hypothetical protein
MPGPRSAYTARTADFNLPYSYEHPWCVLTGFLPAADVPIIGVYGWNRGGGNTSEPSVWDRWGYDPDSNVGDDGALIEPLLEAGFVYVKVEYPNGPLPVHTSRHHPTYREPHNWMFAQRAFQFMQTHAADGLITNSRSRALPQDYRGYTFSGTSAGALNAAMVALSPRGHMRYDSLFRRNFGYDAVTADGRIRGAKCDDLPAEFQTYGGALSASTLAFIGDPGRVIGDTFNNPALIRSQRVKRIRRENLQDIGPRKLAALRAEENLHVSLWINNAGGTLEASYFASGLTFTVSASTGSFLGATSISVAATPTITATVKKIVDLGGGQARVFAEAGAGVYVRQWVGNLTLGGATVTSYSVVGNDARKAFLSRQQAVAIAEAADFGPFEDQATPHHVLGGGLLATERERLFEATSATNIDKYTLGSEYPAELSGDTPCVVFQPNYDQADDVLSWLSDIGFEVD